MTYFAQNLKHLRKRSARTQEQLGRAIQLGRTTIANYESGLSAPTDPEVLVRLSQLFDVSIDAFLTRDLSQAFGPAGSAPRNGARLAQEGTAADGLVPYVAREESVHYGALSADPAYLATLPLFRFPGLPSGTYRLFEVADAALSPRFAPGDRVLCRRVEAPEELAAGAPCLVHSTAHGLLLRRVLVRPGRLLRLLSDAGQSVPAELEWDAVQELWQVEWLLSPRLEPVLDGLYSKIADLEQQVLTLSHHRSNT